MLHINIDAISIHSSAVFKILKYFNSILFACNDIFYDISANISKYSIYMHCYRSFIPFEMFCINYLHIFSNLKSCHNYTTYRL